MPLFFQTAPIHAGRLKKLIQYAPRKKPARWAFSLFGHRPPGDGSVSARMAVFRPVHLGFRLCDAQPVRCRDCGHHGKLGRGRRRNGQTGRAGTKDGELPVSKDEIERLHRELAEIKAMLREQSPR